MLRFHLLATAAVLPFLPTASLAQETFDLGEVVLSGSLSPVAEDRTGATVEVLEGDDLATGDTSVLRQLDRLPGISFSANGGLGTNSSLRLRGLDQKYLLVRVNGIDMNDPSATQNSFDFGSLTSAGIGRIEVLKGSQSAIYGSEAIGGVIDITTYQPKRLGFSGTASTEFGSFNTQTGTLSLGYLTDRLELAYTYSRILTDGFSAKKDDGLPTPDEDGFQQTTQSLTARYNLSDDLAVGIALNDRRGDVEFDDKRNRYELEEQGARVFGEWQMGSLANTISYSYFDISRPHYFDIGSPTAPSYFEADYEGSRRRLSYLGTAELSNTATLNFGVDKTEESFLSNGSHIEENTVSAQVELLLRPNDVTDVSAAFRHDDNSSFGGKSTGRLAAAWRAKDDLAFRAVLGTGFRTPSLYERFTVPIGNPAFRPEESRSFELGVEKTYGDAASLNATLFYTEIDDLIEFDRNSTVCNSGYGCYVQRPGTTKSRGIELAGTYALSATTEVFGNYTYTDARTEGVRLARTPKHDLVLGMETELTDRLQATLDIRHAGDVVPSDRAPADHKVGTYTLVGAAMSYDVTDTAQAYVRIENLFDEDYETAGGYNTPGRSAFFGVRADF